MEAARKHDGRVTKMRLLQWCHAFALLFALGRADAADHDNGVVSFANSGAPAAQSDFLTGLAQLHNFQYPEAARSFRRAEQIDPGFAMAYWGEAMSYTHPIWGEEDLPASRKALAAVVDEASLPPKERSYLETARTLFGDGDRGARFHGWRLAAERMPLPSTLPEIHEGNMRREGAAGL